MSSILIVQIIWVDLTSVSSKPNTLTAVRYAGPKHDFSLMSLAATGENTTELCAQVEREVENVLTAQALAGLALNASLTQDELDLPLLQALSNSRPSADVLSPRTPPSHHRNFDYDNRQAGRIHAEIDDFVDYDARPYINSSPTAGSALMSLSQLAATSPGIEAVDVHVD